MPHEDSNLEGHADRPYRVEDAWSGRVRDGAVERLHGEVARGLEMLGQVVVVVLQQDRLMESHKIKELMPSGNLRRPKWPPEREAP